MIFRYLNCIIGFAVKVSSKVMVDEKSNCLNVISKVHRYVDGFGSQKPDRC